jgi:YVTN family beta-propeller protein
MRHHRAWPALLFLYLCFEIPTPAASAQKVRLYVDNSEGDDVSVIDLKTLNPVDDIRLADKVHGLAIQADGRWLFATIESDNTLRVVDTATDKVSATIKLTGRPNQCAVTPDGHYVAVPIRDKNAVDIVDVQQQKVVKTLPVSKPHNAFNAGSNRYLFVSAMGANQINVIDLTTMAYAAKVTVGGIPRPYVVTPDGTTMYVAVTDLHGFIKVDVASGKMQRVAMPAENHTPKQRSYEPSNTLTHGLALSPDGTELWVTSLLDNSLYVYDVKGNKITGRVQVGDGPNWVTFSPDGKYVCVSNTGTNDVSIIDALARREVKRVKVGKAPKRVVAAVLGAPGIY